MSYKATVRSCYIGIFSQAVVVNITALLFTTLGYQFGLSFTQLGALVLINFIMQVSIAIIFGQIVDRVGFRPFIVGAHIAAVVGLAWFALVPALPFDPYAMMIMATIIFGIAAGFFELLISPILNAIPADEKSSAMSILHGFYCFGHLGVVFATTIFLFVFGRDSWPFIVSLWLVLPLLNAFLFSRCPIAPAVEVTQQSSAGAAFRSPLFIILILMISLGAASELTFAQWTSAFMEEAMGLPKVIGDIMGVGMFALSMGVGRVAYGVLKQRETAWLPSQAKLMAIGSAMAISSYIIAATTNYPVLGLLACILCGLGVSLLWPGTLSLAVDAFPKAGTWMFAIMAATGNIGASAGPAVFGLIADYGGLRAGFMMTAIFPVLTLVAIILFLRLRRS